MAVKITSLNPLQHNPYTQLLEKGNDDLQRQKAKMFMKSHTKLIFLDDYIIYALVMTA